ncbi:hypothetical protein [Desulfurivibrio sp. C05AmB]|uniref:hypothetical protein n=1 Tax=Desulfurivibrio sp. C05AmB TaxID=3374371 RepID=UPI00376EAC61
MMLQKMIMAVMVSGFLLQPALAEMICPSTEYTPSYRSDQPIVDADELITIQGPLLPGGKIFCRVTHYVEYNVRSRIEEGTYNNLKYRFWYSNGSGAVQGLPTNTLDYEQDKYGTNWSLGCQKYQADDAYWCSLYKPALRVVITKDASYLVSVGRSHYPGSSITVRVDDNEPIQETGKTVFSKQQSAAIVEQLKRGESVLTRYQEWPHREDKDEVIDLFGFKEALAIMEKIHQVAGPGN